ncbi:MAG: FKBP-type peptidyl-prolyl cis-trans isomerase [Simkaniaceae bacterium]|nr:FKBP-type peptidyl-prolyl cis-trans isomerase [Simkaniaceae bacterium]
MAEGDGQLSVREGKQVAIEYSICLPDKTTVDTNVGKEPLVFNVGKRQILPALEERLTGLEVGDEAQVALKPEQAYGHINPDAFREVDIELIPQGFRFEGALLTLADEKFGNVLIRVDSLGEEKAVLDFNHPLAGKELLFNIRVLDIS